MQGWRTRAEVAKQLGMTERTLQRRLNEAGIRPARPGRTAMLSDADVTKLMEESRGRSPSKMQRSLDGPDRETAQDTGALPTELQEIIGILDGSPVKPLPPPEALIQQYAAQLRKSLKPLPPIPELSPDPPETEEPPPA
jgi:excisionase family DNA binding protein